jgi:TRAP-type C4-dicarboxylate transport system substrate-binding protein
MRVTTDTPDVMPQGVTATWFGQEVQKRIPGSQVKIYNDSSLMNNPDSMEAMHSGTLEAPRCDGKKGVFGLGPESKMPKNAGVNCGQNI